MKRRLAWVFSLAVAATRSEGAASVWPVNGHIYEPVAVPAGITWTEANAAAIAAGGYLATITSPEENAFVFDLVANDNSFWSPFGVTAIGPWLGGFQPPNSPEPDGGWQWVTSEPWGYTNWTPGEPNNYDGIEAFLHFWGSTGVHAPTWNDNSDNFAKPVGYILEFYGPVKAEPTTWGRVKALFR